MKYLNLNQGNDTQAENTLSRKFARITVLQYSLIIFFIFLCLNMIDLSDIVDWSRLQKCG